MYGWVDGTDINLKDKQSNIVENKLQLRKVSNMIYGLQTFI